MQYLKSKFIITVLFISFMLSVFNISHITSHAYEYEGLTDVEGEILTSPDLLDMYPEEETKLSYVDPRQGESFTEKEIEFILAQIEDEYPDISERALEAVEDALGYVGNIGYSQNHHACDLDGDCKLSDCSGFVSHIWEDELGGIYTTSTFYSHFKPYLFKFSEEAQPGDILLHYSGDSHALIYVGYIDLNNGEGYQHYTIDCTTIKGKGNVYFSSNGDKYIYGCYVLPMSNFIEESTATAHCKQWTGFEGAKK